MSIISKLNKSAGELRLQQQGETVDDGPPESAQDASERFRCRVCGREAPDPAFCLDCLAETMEPVPSESESS